MVMGKESEFPGSILKSPTPVDVISPSWNCPTVTSRVLVQTILPELPCSFTLTVIE